MVYFDLCGKFPAIFHFMRELWKETAFYTRFHTYTFFYIYYINEGYKFKNVHLFWVFFFFLICQMLQMCLDVNRKIIPNQISLGTQYSIFFLKFLDYLSFGPIFLQHNLKRSQWKNIPQQNIRQKCNLKKHCWCVAEFARIYKFCNFSR